MIDDVPAPYYASLSGACDIKAVLPSEVAQVRPSTSTTADLASVLLGLSLAVLLPPDALIPPPSPAQPVVHAQPLVIAGAVAVAAALQRRAAAVGAGHVLLEEVDRRLRGLVLHLNAY